MAEVNKTHQVRWSRLVKYGDLIGCNLLSHENGCSIHFFGCEYPDSYRGLYAILADQTSQLLISHSAKDTCLSLGHIYQ